MRKSLLAGLSLTVLGLTGCYPWPFVEKAGDLTGDGRADVILKMSSTTYCSETKFLFVQEENGSFKRYERITNDDSNFGNKYFWDGEVYREAVKPGTTPEKK